jgi:hypothetical protein
MYILIKEEVTEMPTEKPRVTITMSETQLKQIDDFRFENKIKNQTQAMVLLMEEGMKSIVEQQENQTTQPKGRRENDDETRSQLWLLFGPCK